MLARPYISKADVITGLCRFLKAHPKGPHSAPRFERWPDRPFSVRTARNRFGSWNAALRAAGLQRLHVHAYPPRTSSATSRSSGAPSAALPATT